MPDDRNSRATGLLSQPEKTLTETEKARRCLLQMIDYAIVEGAFLHAPTFVHYLRLARSELEYADDICSACGQPRTRLPLD